MEVDRGRKRIAESKTLRRMKRMIEFYRAIYYREVRNN